MELNREQVKKAYEHCTTKVICKGCPCWREDKKCTLREDTLSLITSQEQRIKELTEEKEKLGLLIDELEKEKRELWEERNRIYNDLQDWKAIAEQYQKQFEDCAEDRAKLTEENERLRADCAKGANAIIEEMQKNRTIKADTVREMLQRIKEDAISVSLLSNPPKFMLEIREDAIDQIAKEMLEGGDQG